MSEILFAFEIDRCVFEKYVLYGHKMFSAHKTFVVWEAFKFNIMFCANISRWNIMIFEKGIEKFDLYKWTVVFGVVARFSESIQLLSSLQSGCIFFE